MRTCSFPRMRRTTMVFVSFVLSSWMMIHSVVVGDPSLTSSSATFDLYDNGASTGSVSITMTRTEFHTKYAAIV
eukprot:CAMPEP_0195298422 /NCGR_PEP_ID=MMETSP0707-20130614/23430_1 /TAXON_ID=33640 /ORGANISM="Asterionellopsis glacialis, Strain CCMP134" /LENGTH=73 /DNA_ID=CAMNT_0040360525 /DNA_START=91 /DNA_END=308 /DNA_ORIENTATION=+